MKCVSKSIMPLFTIPSLTSHVYADGSAVSPGDVAVPVLLVQDSDNKVTMVRGAPVHIYDRQPPAVSGLSVQQQEGTSEIRPAADR